MEERAFSGLITQISENKILELNLNNQEISDQEARTILAALRENNTITSVSCLGTKISSEAKKSIEAIIQERFLLPEVSPIALNRYKEEAEAGDLNKQFNLGWMYARGIGGVKADIVEAIKWYTLAANQEHPMAMYNLAVLYLGDNQQKDIKVGTAWAIKAATRRDIPEARVLLGYLYETGIGVVQNFQQAIKLYRQAAEEGCAEAYYRLYLCYKDGRKGVLEKNIKIADKWLKKAQEENYLEKSAKMGNVNAQYEWGLMLEDSSPKEAEHYFELAADQKHILAPVALGNSIKKRLKSAVYPSSAYLGSLLSKEQKDNRALFEKGLNVLMASAQRGNAKAQFNLSCYIEFGIRYNYWADPNKSRCECLQWLLMAYDQGYREFNFIGKVSEIREVVRLNLVYLHYSISMDAFPVSKLENYCRDAKHLLLIDDHKIRYYKKNPSGFLSLTEEIDLKNLKTYPSGKLYDLFPAMGSYMFYDIYTSTEKKIYELKQTFYSIRQININDDLPISMLLHHISIACISSEEIEKRYEEGCKRASVEQLEIPPVFLSTLPLSVPEVALLESAENDKYETYQAFITLPGLDVFRIHAEALMITLEKDHLDFAKKLLLSTERIDIGRIVNEKGVDRFLKSVIDTKRTDLIELVVKRMGAITLYGSRKNLENMTLSRVQENQFEIYQICTQFPGLNVRFLNSVALVCSMEGGLFDFACRLLVLEHIDINIINVAGKKMTSLELAIRASNLKTFELIIKRVGLNVNLNCPLLMAVQEEEDEMVKRLLTHPELDINTTKSPCSETALWIASKNGNVAIVKVLLTHKDINVNYKCSKLTPKEQKETGKIKLTAQEVASYYGHEAVVAVIQDYKDVKSLREQAIHRRQRLKDGLGAENRNLLQAVAQEDDLSARMKRYEEEIELLRSERKQFEMRLLQQQTENQQMARQMNEMFTMFKATFTQAPKPAIVGQREIERIPDEVEKLKTISRIQGQDL